MKLLIIVFLFPFSAFSKELKQKDTNDFICLETKETTINCVTKVSIERDREVINYTKKQQELINLQIQELQGKIAAKELSKLQDDMAEIKKNIEFIKKDSEKLPTINP